MVLEGWTFIDEKIECQYVFPDFLSCFGFMACMALFSESINHHPEWSNIYNRLLVKLSTHDTNGVTERDIQWAEKANAQYNLFNSKKKVQI